MREKSLQAMILVLLVLLVVAVIYIISNEYQKKQEADKKIQEQKEQDIAIQAVQYGYFLATNQTFYGISQCKNEGFPITLGDRTLRAVALECYQELKK